MGKSEVRSTWLFRYGRQNPSNLNSVLSPGRYEFPLLVPLLVLPLELDNIMKSLGAEGCLIKSLPMNTNS